MSLIVDRNRARAQIRFLLGASIADIVIDLIIDSVIGGSIEGQSGVNSGSNEGQKEVKTGSEQGQIAPRGQKSDLIPIRSSLFSSPGSEPLKASSSGVVNMMSPPGFNEFWSVFWRRVKRAKAIQAWVKIGPDPELTRVIVAAVKAQSAEQLGREAHFRPHAATWLNGREWENEAAAPVRGAGMSERERRGSIAADAFVARGFANGGNDNA